MSDSFENITGQNQAARPACRVAYTINNHQPVISTIIGDQPLFYMDYDCGYEDEEDLSFDAADIGILEKEIRSLKNEIDSMEKLSASFVIQDENKIDSFLDNASTIFDACSSKQKTSIEKLLETLRKSRLATAYLASAEEHKVKLHYSAQVETAYYDRNSCVILINPNLSHADQILIASQELRRHWQHRQGALINPLMFHPDNAVVVNRAQVADLAVSMIRVAWELQLSGEKTAWERIENSSMADLGRAFAREAFLDFRTINNGLASAAVFESWFLSERCRMQDKNLINQMLADYKGYVFDLHEAEQSITPNLIAALGKMPFGKNYLAEHAIIIMEDTIFTDVRDRSNANFLWFIKFERSFRESEQELQTSSDLTASDNRAQATSQRSEDENHAFFSSAPAQKYTGQSAEIITLFEAGAEEDIETGDKSSKNSKRLAPKGSSKRMQDKGDLSNVVYIRRSPGE